MTKFEIHTTNNRKFRFLYRFNTRSKPVILYRGLHDSHEACINEINETKKYSLSVQNISFKSNMMGFMFSIYNTTGNDVAFSRYFPTQKLMKKIF